MLFTLYLHFSYIKLILSILLIQSLHQIPAHRTDAELWEEAHRNLIRKTREYVKENPISDELREFIHRFKHIHESKENGKAKRQDTSNMYAVKDGEVVPVNELNQDSKEFTDSELGANFTVVPLIIPVPLEHNVTLSEKPKEDIKEDEKPEKSSSNLLGRGGIYKNSKKIKQQDTCSKEYKKITENTLNPTAEETVNPTDLIEARMKGTKSPSEFSRMLDDMEQLINTQKRAKSNNEGTLCNIHGYWDSEAGGKTIHIYTNHSDNQNHTSVTIFEKDPPVDEGFLIRDKWNVTAEIPFPHTAELILIATAWKSKKIAIFIGECRICEGSETITGDWMIGRTSTSCKDQKASHSFFSDILRKNNVPALQNDHFKKINMSTLKPPEDNAKIKK